MSIHRSVLYRLSPALFISLAWVVIYAALNIWTGKMIQDGSEKTLFGMIGVATGSLLLVPFLAMLSRGFVHRFGAKKALAQGALWAFFAGIIAPMYFLHSSERWELYNTVAAARAKIEVAERAMGHASPLRKELASMTQDVDQAKLHELDIADIAGATTNQELLHVFQRAHDVGRGQTVDADYVLANGLVRPQDLKQLRTLAQALRFSQNATDQAMFHMIRSTNENLVATR